LQQVALKSAYREQDIWTLFLFIKIRLNAQSGFLLSITLCQTCFGSTTAIIRETNRRENQEITYTVQSPTHASLTRIHMPLPPSPRSHFSVRAFLPALHACPFVPAYLCQPTKSPSLVEIGQYWRALCLVANVLVVFSLYLAFYWSSVVETSHLSLTSHALETIKAWLKLMNNEGHFTLETKTAFRPYLASHSSGVTEISHLTLPTHSLQLVQIWSNSVGNEGHFTRRSKQFFVPISHRISEGGIIFVIWCSLPTCHNRCTFGRNRLITKGTLLHRPKEFLVPVSPGVVAGWMSHHSVQPLLTSYNRSKVGRNRSVTKGTLLFRP
jgi:hypothetical protein